MFPIQLEKSSTISGTDLYLMLNKGRLQLGTDKAIYSWEDLYYPFEIAFNQRFDEIMNARNCLVIGLGMGSVISILTKQLLLDKIHFIGIEKEKSIATWVEKYTIQIGSNSIQVINDDAENLSKLQLVKFDIICVDVFQNRSVPAFMQSEKHLNECFSLLNENGILFYNIIPQDAEKLKEKSFQENFKSVFENNTKIKMKENEMWIGKK